MSQMVVINDDGLTVPLATVKIGGRLMLRINPNATPDAVEGEMKRLLYDAADAPVVQNRQTA